VKHGLPLGTGTSGIESPTPNSQPFSIAQAGGPGSKIWFTERGAAKIGAMTFP
jgi:hypothetical protein